ncbi:MAG: UDP-3-O-(3-hydroxymyristoyl)glucosamine N-acyltransferase [Synergistales bacterium]|nr:UDP-3-O-(3-hydroxymyristoyl)glucosamine N-acyltransferase [Synergistales bacterium]MDY6402251.1 UDP-3-O-(3-hydroxymyristoyl)glucosamine N-acyltransferase [Synergistales bacterium]MDY6404970.1 UDP-3-O-(3-hydroxymyristoyl)glucosamine N-acyltransferase [Synergistales bacterium]MDY6410333.1 UDP-3-O-(3-hydroxymyristoyl)glucosamine N-acyltransferase [Synergistales bacterium]MDY6414319.1 UDP-3-O-(3-hydroxymyristoyl)glucosamine N-acyltransferase [Synergistales bacterium]
MKMTLASLCEKLNNEKISVSLAGNSKHVINRIASPEEADKNSLCVIWEKKELENLSRDIPIAGPEKLFLSENGQGRDGLITDGPRALLPKLIALFSEPVEKPKGIHPSAVIASDAKVKDGAYVGACAVVESGAVIEDGAEIHAGAFVGKKSFVGNNTVIEPKAVLLSDVKVGKNCLIHSGAVIGCDGFGFVRENGAVVKIPQTGGVTIGDDVEIGACTTIDRGTMHDTIIGSGTKIDNHVQIGHNVQIGNHCIICSMSGIAGSSILEDYVTVSVQVGITDHVTIGKGATLAGRTGVTNDIEAGALVSGFPARPHNAAKRALVLAADLPIMSRKLRLLEKKVDAMQKNEA